MLKKVERLLLVVYGSKIIHDEEFIASSNFPYNSYTRFELENMQGDECLAEFRIISHDTVLK